MFRRSLVGVAVLLAVVAAPAQGQEVKLQWKFKEGEKFYVRDVQTTKTTVTVLGMLVKEEGKTTTVTSYHIKKVNSDSVVLVQKIEDVDAKSQGGLGGMSEKILEKTKGATFTITMTPEGKITKFEGYKDFAKKLVGDDDELGKMLNTFLNEDVFKMSAEQVFTMMPKDPVKKGDTWKQESKMPVPGLGDFKTATTYTYKGKHESGDESIGVKQSLSYQVPKGGGDIGGVMKILKGNLKADNAKGNYVFSPEKGRLTSGYMLMDIRGSLTVEFSGQNLDLVMSIEQETTTRVFDENPLKD